jgi:phenylalanyl-tRNA synthetase beta chain
MPVITLDTAELRSLLGRQVPLDELKARIPMMGAEIESATESEINAEFFPNRPDLYSVEGVARALKGFLGIEEGLRAYEAGKSNVTLKVERSVEAVRPFIACGMVRGVSVDDRMIRSLMQLQEKLHLTLGRKRRKVAIGVHDARALKQPFVYRAVKPKEVSFVPLGKTEEMDLAEILERHEKGVEYAEVLRGKPVYPIIQDAGGQVLSFPPIINGTVTEVTEATGDIFLDVTGTDLRTNCVVLNIIATALADRGGKIETVDVRYHDKALAMPDLAPGPMVLDMAYARKMTGMNLEAEDAAKALRRMRFGAQAKGDKVYVLVPAYRSDILHPIDLVEDAAIGHGYDMVPLALPKSPTFAKARQIETVSDAAAASLVGMGYLEVSTLTLSNEREQFDLLRLEKGQRTTILNPATEEHTCLRVSLLPGLMATLRGNKRRELPQRVFECGDVVVGHANQRMCAAASIHPKASFTEMKSVALALLRDLGHPNVEVEREEWPTFIEGRCASIASGGKKLGRFGEVHPEAITGFELQNPVAALELDLTKI